MTARATQKLQKIGPGISKSPQISGLRGSNCGISKLRPPQMASTAPCKNAASPIVTISTETTGCPASGLSTKRSTAKAVNEIPSKPNSTDNHKGKANTLWPV